MSFIFDLNRLFALKSIHNKLTFLRSNGFTYTEAQTIAHKVPIRVSIEHIYKLCLAFNCSPNDLFTYTPDEKSNLPQGHPLNSLVRPKSHDVDNLLKDLSPDKVTKFLDDLDKLKNS